jgi:hypothetical protein
MQKKSLNLDKFLEKEKKLDQKLSNAVLKLESGHKYLLTVIKRLSNEISSLRDELNDLRSRRK